MSSHGNSMKFLMQSLMRIFAWHFVFRTSALKCYAYCLGDLNSRDIAGIWRLRSTESFLPTFHGRASGEGANLLRKESVMGDGVVEDSNERNDMTVSKAPQNEPDILLLFTEDGQFVQYVGKDFTTRKTGNKALSVTDNSINSIHGFLKGQWAIVDGKLILAKDRPDNYNNLRSEAKVKDTLFSGKIVATTTAPLSSSNSTSTSNSRSENMAKASNDMINNSSSIIISKEDVHLAVRGNVKVGTFFYPQRHPNFFDQPMVNAVKTGSFELQQILGKLNTAAGNDKDDDLQPVEKFRKKDLSDKTYFLTSFPLPKRKKRQRWSIKYNDYVDYRPSTDEEKAREEAEKNEPIAIKTFEVQLFSNNTFSTVHGLGGDTILRGKWSILGEERDQLWMTVYRFGFGRSVSGSTFSEGKYLSNQDEVSYWGTIYEVDVAPREDSIEDDPMEWKGTRIEVNGAVMVGIGLEPTSVAKFTMIEKTEEDVDEEDYSDDEDDDYDETDVGDNIGSFE